MKINSRSAGRFAIGPLAAAIACGIFAEAYSLAGRVDASQNERPAAVAGLGEAECQRGDSPLRMLRNAGYFVEADGFEEQQKAVEDFYAVNGMKPGQSVQPNQTYRLPARE